MKSIYKFILSIFALCCCFTALSAQDKPTLSLDDVKNDDQYYKPVQIGSDWYVVGNGKNNFNFKETCPPSDTTDGSTDGVQNPTSDTTYTCTYVRYQYAPLGFSLDNQSYIQSDALNGSLNSIIEQRQASVRYVVKKTKQTRVATFKNLKGQSTLDEFGEWKNDEPTEEPSDPVNIYFYKILSLSPKINNKDWPNKEQNEWTDTEITISADITGGYMEGNIAIITIDGKTFDQTNYTHKLTNIKRQPIESTIKVSATTLAPDNNTVWGNQEELTKSVTYRVWSEPELEKESSAPDVYRMFQANQNGKCYHTFSPTYIERGAHPTFAWSISGTNNAGFTAPNSKDTEVYCNAISLETRISCTLNLTEKPVDGMTPKKCSVTYNLSIVPKPKVGASYTRYPVFFGEEVEEAPRITPSVIVDESLHWKYSWSNGNGVTDTNIGSFTGTTLGEDSISVTASCELVENTNDPEQRFSEVKTFRYKVFEQPEVSLECSHGRYVLEDSSVSIRGEKKDIDATLTGVWSADDKGNNLCEFKALKSDANEMDSINHDFDWTYSISYGVGAEGKSVDRHGRISYNIIVCNNPDYHLNGNEEFIRTCGGHPTDVGVKITGGFPNGWNVTLFNDKLDSIGNFQSEKIIFENENETGFTDVTYFIQAKNSAPYADGRPDSANWYPSSEPKPITVRVHARPRLTNIVGVSRNDTIRQYYGMSKNISFGTTGGFGTDPEYWEIEWLQDTVLETCANTVNGIIPNLGTDKKSGTIETDEEGPRAHATKIRYAIVPLHSRNGEQFCHDTLWFNYEAYSKGAIYSLEPKNENIYGSSEECRGVSHNEALINLYMAGGYDRGWEYKWTPLNNEEFIVSDSASIDAKDGNHGIYRFDTSNETDSIKPILVKVTAKNRIPGLKEEEQGNEDSISTTIKVYPKAKVNLLVFEDNNVDVPDTILFYDNAIDSLHCINPEDDKKAMSLDTHVLNLYFGDSIQVKASVSGGAKDAWYTSARVMNDTLQFESVKADSIYSYSLNVEALSDSATMAKYQNLISLQNYGPSGELWAEVTLPLTTQWWSKGTVTTDYKAQNLYGSARQSSVPATPNNVITLSADSKGGYLPGYSFWWTYDDNAKDYFAERHSEEGQTTSGYFSEQPIFKNYLKARNFDNEPKVCIATLHWENKIDENHIGNSDSISFCVCVYPRVSFPEFIESSDSHAQGLVNMRQIQTADGNVSFAVMPEDGGLWRGGQWNYLWMFDNLCLDQDSSVMSIDVSNQFPGVNGMSKKVVPIKLVWNNTNPDVPTEIWECDSLTFVTCVYNSPKRPVKLQQKGSGASNIYIADMGEMTDTYWMNNGYIFEFGDKNNSLVEREVVQRWHQYSSRPINPWVRTLWEYPAHGDNGLFPEFTASFGWVDLFGNVDTRSETGIHSVYEDSSLSGSYIYTLNGHLLRFFGEDEELNLDLPTGMYILETRSGASRVCKKIMIK